MVVVEGQDLEGEAEVEGQGLEGEVGNLLQSI